MVNDVPRRALEAFRRLPSADPAEATQIAGRVSAPEAHRVVRLLEDLGLVDLVSRRPKRVRLAGTPFPQALHGLLRTRPHFAPLVVESRLPVLAVLATAEAPLATAELSRRAGRHPNTVRPVLALLARRALLEKRGDACRIASHAPELRNLGALYAEHLLERALRNARGAFPVQRTPLRAIVEAEDPVPGLDPTGVFRFQLEGADVLAPRPQYVIAAFRMPTTLRDALDDALALNPPPRVKRAMEDFLRRRSHVT